VGRYGLIVARLKPGAEDGITRAFAESDATELPALGRLHHRSIFVMGDLYLHLIETDGEFEECVGAVRDHPLFKEVSAAMVPFVSPYDPATWRSPRDSFAREIYAYDPPDGETRTATS